MHIVIMGAGKVGEYLARTSLQSGNEVALIEIDSDRCDVIAASIDGKVVVINGDGCDSTYMEDARISQADIFVAASGHDDNNLVACEVAKRVFSVPRCIARVNNPRNVRIFRKLGIESVSSTTLIANLIEEEAMLGSMNAVSTLTQNNMGLVELQVPPMRNHNPIEGVAVEDIELPEGCIIVAVENDDGLQIAYNDTLVHAGNRVIFAGDTDVLRRVRSVFRNL